MMHPLGLSLISDGVHSPSTTSGYDDYEQSFNVVPDGLAYEMIGTPGQPGAYTRITVDEDLDEIFFIFAKTILIWAQE